MRISFYEIVQCRDELEDVRRQIVRGFRKWKDVRVQTVVYVPFVIKKSRQILSLFSDIRIVYVFVVELICNPLRWRPEKPPSHDVGNVRLNQSTD
jgi:hypothetical protein